MRGLLARVVLGDGLGVLGWRSVQVLGDLEEGHFLVALLEDICRADEAALVEEDLGAVENEPGEGEIEDEGEVDGLAKTRAGAVVVERVEQVDELGVVELAEAAGADFQRLDLVRSGGKRGRVGGCFERGHGWVWIQVWMSDVRDGGLVLRQGHFQCIGCPRGGRR